MGSQNNLLQMQDLVYYTDGACPNNGQAQTAAIGVICENTGYRISKHVPHHMDFTNNVAELWAVLTSIYAAKNFLWFFRHNRYRYGRIVIYTDSKYVIGCVQDWHQKWESNGWKTSAGKPVKNQDLIQKILVQIERQSFGKPIEIRYCQAHAGIEHNELADELARMSLNN